MATKKAKPKRQVSCSCANLVDNRLRDFNTRLVKQICLNMDTRSADAALTIATEKIDAKKRAPKKTVLATYCPFCGRKL